MVPLLVESWLWWSLVIVIAGCRFVSRRMVLGSFKKYQVDDYLMMVVLGFYTTVIAVINMVRHTSSNLLPPGFNVATLTQPEIAARMYGSKLILVVEQSQCVTIWGAKLCLLTLYLRLTTLRWENIAIRVLIGYVIGSFIVMDILYFGVWCRPFHEYWAVPTDSPQCDAATDHLITNAVFNLTSDCAMLAIGLPMFLRMNLPLRKKIPLVGVFSLGVFVILAAILNKIYSFTDPFGSLWTFWYVRESSTALLVANLPYVWTIWRKIAGSHSFFGMHMGRSSDDGVEGTGVGGARSSSGEGGGGSGGGGGEAGTTRPRSGSEVMREKLRMDVEFRRAPTMEQWLRGGDDKEAVASTSSPSSSSGGMTTAATSLHEQQTAVPATPGKLRFEEFSFADMLSDAQAAPVGSSKLKTEGGEEDCNPVTHPALFYSRARAGTAGRGIAAGAVAAVSTQGQATPDTIAEAEIDPSSQSREAGPSSLPPSSRSPKSTHSVV